MISRLLTTWINFIYLRLATIPFWPSPEAVEQNLLSSFKTHYSSTIIIVDCSELRCEVPSSLPLQLQLYSTYKSHTTLKGLVGITPSGAVSFISKLFTGSISDREIFQESGILDMLKTLPPRKSLIADKGFDVEDLLAPAGIRVNIPPMKGKEQLSDADVIRTQRIARVRVHVERAIANFCVLDQVIPLSLLGSINQIWTICCMLTNFKPPLFDVIFFSFFCAVLVRCYNTVHHLLTYAHEVQQKDYTIYTQYCDTM